jgi:uncharacterized glyoxalase superfamily protein PhnB
MPRSKRQGRYPSRDADTLIRKRSQVSSSSAVRRVEPYRGDIVAVMPDYGADPQIIPYLLYEDAGAAMDWLIRVFGFTERARDPHSNGTVRHGELMLDNGGVIMLGSPGAGFRGPAKLGEVTQLQCITIADVPAHRERAEAAGADVSEISMRASRARSYTVDDPEGHRWYFSEPL